MLPPIVVAAIAALNDNTNAFEVFFTALCIYVALAVADDARHDRKTSRPR
jgi:hypothetical protein